MARIDPPTEEVLARLLKELATEDTLILVFEHRLDYLLAYADRVILLDQGTVLTQGKTSEVISALKDVDKPELLSLKTPADQPLLTIIEAVDSLKKILR